MFCFRILRLKKNKFFISQIEQVFFRYIKVFPNLDAKGEIGQLNIEFGKMDCSKFKLGKVFRIKFVV